MNRLKRYLLLLIVAGAVLWSFFCLIAGFLVWIVARPPRYGDDTGLGILCISIPLAVLCALIVLRSFDRTFISRR